MKKVASLVTLLLAAALSALLTAQAFGDSSRPRTPEAWSALPLPPIPEINTMPWLAGWRASADGTGCTMPAAGAVDERMSADRRMPKLLDRLDPASQRSS